MARVRTSTAGFSRLLNSAARPIYVLDGEQRIVFCNRACRKWLGPAADVLVGARCAYHSSSHVAGTEAIAAGLCPSPAALEGRECYGIVARTDSDGQIQRRRARFLPLDGTEGTGVLVLVETADLTEPEAAAAEAEQDESVQLHERIRRYRRQFAACNRLDWLVGDSPAMRRARAQVELASASRASVLVVGPVGSGRHSVAEAIHYVSGSEPRGALIPLACSVLGADLIQSTLAAVADPHTLREKAASSTLLLNDVDALPLEVQIEATRVLTSRSFPLRVLATARGPLLDLVQQGRYRDDLAAALSTLVIVLPPLCERRQDIPVLAQLFLEEMNVRGKRQLAGFTPEALDALDAYTWPGNVRELVQIVSEAHARARGPEVTLADLPDRIHLAASAAAHPRVPEEKIVLDDFLGQVERELISRALARAKGNKTKAARLLGMTRPRLYRRLIQLGLEKAE